MFRLDTPFENNDNYRFFPTVRENIVDSIFAPSDQPLKCLLSSCYHTMITI